MKVVEIEGLSWMDDGQVLEEIVGALKSTGKYREGLLYRAFETDEPERVVREGTDRYDASFEDEYGEVIDYEGNELEVTDYVYTASEREFIEQISTVGARTDEMYVSVYDPEMMEDTQTRSGYKFKGDKRESLVALFRVI
jgi:hypothetical protein